MFQSANPILYSNINKIINSSILLTVILVIAAIVLINIFVFVCLFVAYKYRNRIKNKFLSFMIRKTNFNILAHHVFNFFSEKIWINNDFSQITITNSDLELIKVVNSNNNNFIFQLMKVKDIFLGKIYFKFWA